MEPEVMTCGLCEGIGRLSYATCHNCRGHGWVTTGRDTLLLLKAGEDFDKFMAERVAEIAEHNRGI